MKVLFLHQERCRPCTSANAKLQYVLTQDSSLSQYVHSYDKTTVPELIKKYGVDLYPTVLLLDEGHEVERIVGGQNVMDNWIRLFDLCMEADADD